MAEFLFTPRCVVHAPLWQARRMAAMRHPEPPPFVSSEVETRERGVSTSLDTNGTMEEQI